jgi:hypothetical protein
MGYVKEHVKNIYLPFAPARTIGLPTSRPRGLVKSSTMLWSKDLLHGSFE